MSSFMTPSEWVDVRFMVVVSGVEFSRVATMGEALLDAAEASQYTSLPVSIFDMQSQTVAAQSVQPVMVTQ